MQIIGGGNITKTMHFILLGFSDFPRIIAVLFAAFLVIYILTLAWNLSLLILIRMDSHLHTPMYFFLSNLSFMDICYVTSTAPKMLYDFFQEQKMITYVGCVVQYFVFSTMGLSESCLMTAMAYDRYAAICNPLLYSSVMSPALCGRLVLGSYLAGLSGSVSQLCAMLQLHFCGPNVINHFFCDMPQLLVLSCTNTFSVQLLTAIITVIFGIINALVIMTSYVCIVISIMKITTASGRSNHFFCDMPQLLVLSCTDTFSVQLFTALLTMIFGIMNALVIMTSYVYIVVSIMRITTASGRSKAFNTCASHLTAVALFYTSSTFVCLSSTSGGSSSFDRFASVLYTVMIPMLNPLIYSLRNKEIKDALKRLQKKRGCC